MYHIISNINNAVNLQQYIDNRDGNKLIGLKSFTYVLGWYNIEEQTIQKKGQQPYHIPPGYYSFQQIADLFKSLSITLSVNENNGVATLTTPDEIKKSDGLKYILGLKSKRWLKPNEEHVGTRPVDFAVVKSLYVHLEQLNTSQNYFNGAPSTILAVISVENREFGDIVSTRFEHPEYKCLRGGDISELKLEVRDENNNKIDNHGLPMGAVLEII